MKILENSIPPRKADPDASELAPCTTRSDYAQDDLPFLQSTRDLHPDDIVVTRLIHRIAKDCILRKLCNFDATGTIGIDVVFSASLTKVVTWY